MTRRGLAHIRFFALLAASLIVGLAGCGTDGQIAAPTQATGTGDDLWAGTTSQPGADPAVQGVGDGYGWGLGGPNRVFSVSVPVEGAVGGVVALGRTVLTIPPGAFEGIRTITIECDNSAALECRLYPEGLQFSRPVRLTMILLGAPPDGTGATIYWWDPNAGSWVDMNGTYNPKGHTVTANLQHFSLYRGGRAGW